jgi:hypothetical protein
VSKITKTRKTAATTKTGKIATTEAKA